MVLSLSCVVAVWRVGACRSFSPRVTCAPGGDPGKSCGRDGRGTKQLSVLLHGLEPTRRSTCSFEVGGRSFYRVLRVRASAIAVLTVLQMAVNSDFDSSSFPREVVTCKDLWTTIDTHFGFLIMVPSTSVWVWCTFNELNLPTVKVLVE